MPDQIPKPVKAARSFALRSLSETKWHRFRRDLLDQSLTAVVLDRRDTRTGHLEALTDNYVTVAFDADDSSVGRTVDLTIEKVTERRTFGRMSGV
jgi:tRNA A37 methylthiotransferase MiaB